MRSRETQPVMNANSNTKTIRAVQFTSATAMLLLFNYRSKASSCDRHARELTDSLILGREIDDRSQDRSDDHPQELIPIKERNARPGRFDRVVEGGPKHRDEQSKLPNIR